MSRAAARQVAARAAAATCSSVCLAVLAGACAPVELSPQRAVHPQYADASPQQLRRAFEREVVPARNVRVAATLWDYALVTGPLDEGLVPGRDVRVDERDDERAARIERWAARYLDGRTSFTVVIELLNRPAPPADWFGLDPLVDPRAWELRLDRGDERDLAPEQVVVQAIDRFPTPGGGHHWRLALAVHFPGSLHDLAAPPASGPLPVRLHVRRRPVVEPPMERPTDGRDPVASAQALPRRSLAPRDGAARASAADGRRREPTPLRAEAIGAWAQRPGVTLRWDVIAPAAALQRTTAARPVAASTAESLVIPTH